MAKDVGRNRPFQEARERLRTPSGMVVERRELADLVNVYLRDNHPDEPWIDRNYIGKVESGRLRWPGPVRRSAFRAVLGVETDADLGFMTTTEEPEKTSSSNGVEPDLRADVLAVSPASLPPLQSTREFLTSDNGYQVTSREAHALASLAPPITVPQRRVTSELLRGRDELLSVVHSFLAVGGEPGDRDELRVLILCGAGGIGKTTTAIELAHRAMSDQITTWWIPANDPDAAIAAMHALAFAIGAEDRDFDRAHPADVLWRRLDKLDQPWLIVIDNLDDPARLASDGSSLPDGVGWLRPVTNSNGRVVITSRDRRLDHWAPWTRLLPVPHLDPVSGAAVLSDLAPAAGSAHDAYALAAALEGLPLALTLAGRYLATTNSDLLLGPDSVTSFAGYRITLDQRLMELPLTTGDNDFSRNERRTIAQTWTLSVDLLERQGHDLVRPLIQLLAAFPPFGLPIQSILRLETLRRCAIFADSTVRTLSGCLRALEGVGLITIEASPPSTTASLVTMHPLVRAAIRADFRLPMHTDEGSNLVTNLLEDATLDLDPNNANNWLLWSQLAPHCLADIESVSTTHAPLENDLARILAFGSKAVWYRYMAGAYQQARTDAASVLGACCRAFGDTAAESINARNILGRCLREAGNSEDAEREFRSALMSADIHFGPADPTTINIRINLARTIRERGAFIDAETELRSIVEIATASLGANDPDTLVANLNLAGCLRGQGRYVEAAAAYEQVLHGWQLTFPEHDLTTLDIRFEKAKVMWQLGEVYPAEVELREILRTIEQIYGTDHPNAITVRHGLATVLRSTGRGDAARTEIQTVLALSSERLGEKHPMTQSVAAELATLE